MKTELDSLKKLYSTTNIKKIIKKQEQARNSAFVKVKRAEFYGYQRAFGFKDSAELVNAVKTLQKTDENVKSMDWIKYLMKYYKVKNQEMLTAKIKLEFLNRDSIDLADMTRFYNVKTVGEAKLIHEQRLAEIRLLSRGDYGISYGYGMYL